VPRRNTRQQKARFLEAVARLPYVTDAAAHAGVNRSTPYDWEKDDPEFAADWAAVRAIRLRQLTDTAMDYALDGNSELMRFLILRFDRQAEGRETNQVSEIAILEYEETTHDDEDGPPPEFFTFSQS